MPAGRYIAWRWRQNDDPRLTLNIHHWLVKVNRLAGCGIWWVPFISGMIIAMSRYAVPAAFRKSRAAAFAACMYYQPALATACAGGGSREKELRMTTTTTIATRSLGKTGIQVTPIGLGVMELSGGGGLLGRAFPSSRRRRKMPSSRLRWMAASTGLIRQKSTARAFRNAHWQTGLKAAGKNPGRWSSPPSGSRSSALPAISARQLTTACTSWMAFRSTCIYIHQPIQLFFAGSRDERHGRPGGGRQDPLGGVSNFNAERMRRATPPCKSAACPWRPTRCSTAWWTARSRPTAPWKPPASWA